MHVYRLITAGTIEERVIQRTEKKLLLDKVVNRDGTDHIKHVTQDRLGALFLDIKFGSAAVFGDCSLNLLPTKEDIECITDRTRSEVDSQGKLKGNAFHNTSTFDVHKRIDGAEEYEGVDFKKLRAEKKRQSQQLIPAAVRNLEVWDESISRIGSTKRQPKSRFVVVNGKSVLAANNYDLEGGESSVFDRELSTSNQSDFAVKKRTIARVNDHQIWCQHCGDGGTLHCCTQCPVAVHKECSATIRRATPRCAHHWCSVCILTAAQVGGLLYPCQSCPNAFCEDCLPRQAKGFRIIGKCDRFEAMGHNSTKHAAYIHCSEQCEEYAIKVWGWSPKRAVWTLPPEIDVSCEYGSIYNPDIPTSQDLPTSDPLRHSGVVNDHNRDGTVTSIVNQSAAPDLPTSATQPDLVQTCVPITTVSNNHHPLGSGNLPVPNLAVPNRPLVARTNPLSPSPDSVSSESIQATPDAQTPNNARTTSTVPRQNILPNRKPKRKQRQNMFTFEDRILQLQKYKNIHGHADVPAIKKSPDYNLGLWLAAQRSLYKSNKMKPDRLDELRRLSCAGFGDLSALPDPSESPVQTQLLQHTSI